jgi:hypothetical protein
MRFATPNTVPAEMLAVSVPCPKQSVVPLPSSIAVNPGSVRPTNSVCVERMPLSMP